MGDLREAYRTLDVAFGASKADVRQAWHDLNRIWHPDRHVDEHPRLQRKAEDQLKRINEAYERIKKAGFPQLAPVPNPRPPSPPSEEKRARSRSATSTNPPPDERPTNGTAAAHKETTSSSRPRPGRDHDEGEALEAVSQGTVWFAAIGAIGVLLICIYVGLSQPQGNDDEPWSVERYQKWRAQNLPAPIPDDASTSGVSQEQNSPLRLEAPPQEWTGSVLYCSGMTARGPGVEVMLSTSRFITERHVCKFRRKDCVMAAARVKRRAEGFFSAIGPSANVTMSRCERSTEPAFCAGSGVGYICSGTRELCEIVADYALGMENSPARCSLWLPPSAELAHGLRPRASSHMFCSDLTTPAGRIERFRCGLTMDDCEDQAGLMDEAAAEVAKKGDGPIDIAMTGCKRAAAPVYCLTVNGRAICFGSRELCEDTAVSSVRLGRKVSRCAVWRPDGQR